MIDFWIRTQQDVEEAVERFGILPLFKNSIPGFSIEEHVLPEAWFGSEEGVWEWKGPIIRSTGCAYGKFLEGRKIYFEKQFYLSLSLFHSIQLKYTQVVFLSKN